MVRKNSSTPSKLLSYAGKLAQRKELQAAVASVLTQLAKLAAGILKSWSKRS